MEKLTLRPEARVVESFAAGDADPQAGSVQAHELFATRLAACDPFSGPPRCA